MSTIPLEELAPVFAGRSHLDELWQLLSEGRSDLTPEQAVDLALAEARAYEQRGDMAALLKRSQVALELALRSGYREGVAYAYFSLAYCHLQLGNYDRAADLARASLACDERTLYCGSGWRVLALCAQNANDWNSAQTYFERGLRAMRESGWRPGLIGILAQIGLFYRDRGLFELALSTLTEAEGLAGDETSYWHGVIAPYRVGIYLQIGRRAEARRAIDKAPSFSTASRYVELNYRAFAARLMLDEDDYEGAQESLHQAKALAEAQGTTDMLLQIRLDFSRLRRLQGDAPGALEWANEALAFARSLSDRFDEGSALLARARAWHALANLPAAEMDLLSALNIAATLGAQYMAAEATFLLAVLRRQQNHPEAETSWLDAALRIRTGGYAFLLERERELAFPLVAACAHSHAPEIRQSAEGLLESLAKIAPLPLRVAGLGRFEVWQGRRRIADRDWQQRRAGELFRLLLLLPGHSAGRETIAEALCPNQAAKAAQTVLHHATSRLRKILEPDLPEKFPSRYIRAEADQIGLDLPSGSLVDFEEFERQLAPAGNTRMPQRSLVETLALYAGDLYPADRYADWSANMRERLSDLHRRGLMALAAEQLGAGNAEAALGICRQILSSDPWHEDAVLTGMQACLAMNNRPAALALYQTLEHTLQAELRVTPRRDLRVLAASIRKD